MGFLKDTLAFSPGKILAPLIMIFALLLLGRSGNKAEVGAFLLMTTSINFINVVSSQWMQQALIRNIKNHSWSNRVTLYSVAPVYLMSTAGVLLVWLSSVYMGFQAPFGGRGIFWCVACALAVNTFVITSGLSMGVGFVFLYSISEVIRALAYTLGIFLSFLLNDPGILYWSFMGSYLVGFLALMAMTAARRRSAFPGGEARLLSFLKEQASYGMPFVLWFFGAQVLAVIDRYFIDFFFGKADAGIYIINYQIATTAVMLVSGPIVGACHINSVRLMDESAKLWNFISKSAVFYLVVITPVVLAVLVAGPLVIRIFFGHNIPSGPLLLFVIALGQAAWALSMILHKKLELEKKFASMLCCLFAAAAINIVINYYGIPRYGMIMAGWATFLSYTTYALMVTLLNLRHGWMLWEDFRSISIPRLIRARLKVEP